MKPSEILMSEHRVIEQVLNCLEKMVAQLRSEGTLDAKAALESVDFFRNFADKCHHAKEEVHYFPAMESKGFSRESGPTGVMLFEHDEGRTHVKAFEAAIEDAAQGDKPSQETFIQHAEGFVQLLRQHIHKEDHCLFPMGDQAFSNDEQVTLMQKFQKTQEEDIGSEVNDKYVQIANRLAEKYGVPAL